LTILIPEDRGAGKAKAFLVNDIKKLKNLSENIEFTKD
jgi:hypothetical protein